MTQSAIEQQILAWIEEDRDTLVRFLSDFVRIPSPNPPGDTRAVAAFVADHLKHHGAPCEVLHAREDLPNVVGEFGTGAPHLVLNGHIDVFPAGPDHIWASGDPWSGTIADGRIHGRGAVDMKCGTAASIWTFIYLHRLRDKLAGRLSLTCVSDEETGGQWGAKWLLDSFPDRFLGDCCLNGEPSTPATIRFGEKGTLRLRFEVDTPGAHGAYTHASPNAIRVASELILDLYRLTEMPVVQPPAIAAAIAASFPAMDKAVGQGTSTILNRVTVSIGTIQGGLKVNMLPGHCEFEVDIRLPVGMTGATVLAKIDTILARYPAAKVTKLDAHSSDPTASPPDDRMVGILQDVVGALGWPAPVPAVSLGATDTRYWRKANIPAYYYGCTPNGMAKADEAVSIEEYLHMVRTHTLAAARYLAR